MKKCDCNNKFTCEEKVGFSMLGIAALTWFAWVSLGISNMDENIQKEVHTNSPAGTISFLMDRQDSSEASIAGLVSLIQNVEALQNALYEHPGLKVEHFSESSGYKISKKK